MLLNDKNNSPWVGVARPYTAERYSRPSEVDTLIVGGGIAGVVTAYFLLMNTTKSVAIFEMNRIGSGASGHNAGLLTAETEFSINQLIEWHGQKPTITALEDYYRAWSLFENIIYKTNSAKLYNPIDAVSGISGKENLQKLINDIHTTYLHLPELTSSLVIRSDYSELIENIPPQIKHLITTADKREILSRLETDNESYIGYRQGQRMAYSNSYQLSTQLLHWLQKLFPRKLHIYENSTVTDINHRERTALCNNIPVSFGEIVIATNGYTNHTIKHTSLPDIDAYTNAMIGFFTDENSPILDSQIDYFSKSTREDEYFYLSRRTISLDKHLVVFGGGKGNHLKPNEIYHQNEPVHPAMINYLKTAMKINYRFYQENLDYAWHGMMGYTDSGFRYIGRNNRYPNTYFNVGCNGIGLLQSIYGGWKVAELIRGRHFGPSLFDPSF